MPSQPEGNSFSTVRTPGELHALVRERLGIAVPARAICPGHVAPFDYVAASVLGEGSPPRLTAAGVPEGSPPRLTAARVPEAGLSDLTVWANRGGGKSINAAIATLLSGLRRGGLEQVILGGSQEQSDRVAFHLRGLLTPLGELVSRESTRRRIVLSNGSRIHVLAQSQTSVRGVHADCIRCDEVELFDPLVWEAVKFCTTAGAGSATAREAEEGAADEGPVGRLEALSTAHVPGGIMEGLIRACEDPEAAADARAPAPRRRLMKWCLWEVIERCRPERRCRDCPLADDCRGRARRAEGFFRIDDAIAIKARSSRSAWEAEMLCLGARREQLVFPEFDPDVHVGEVGYCADFPTYRAIDFGYAAPFVCLWVQLSPTGTARVIGEYVQTRRSIARHAEEILRRDPGPAQATYVDPAGVAREATSGAACTELLAAGGIPCCWRRSTLAEGLELIRAALAPAWSPGADGDAREGGSPGPRPLLRIDRRCLRLVQAMRTYHYPPPGAPGAGDRPVKDGADHLVDALRYFFVNRMRPGRTTERKGY